MGFDAVDVEAVAGEHGVAAAALHGALADLQSLVADNAAVGGVDGLVYEWRQTYPRDPLVERTPDRYYLAVEDRVWDDFDRRLGFGDALGDVVRAVHARAFSAAIGPPERGVPMVLDRV
jgi:hypothetical protein